MSSIIEGYNYDIYISYRQKDNKHDGWVTEFVDNLNGELESTFKEEISVYFDINPHDGLLETHDVDASLKDKLKCLVFIPIISRTYCDPKSFAWEFELKAFVEQASKDQLGLRVKLPNGNVASRVLPVRIHDLDNDDIKLCESVLGGVLRGVEFIYKEPGVNKPLNPDDDEKKNLNKTKYRIQVNKTANAIKEIILGMKTDSGKSATERKEILSTLDIPLTQKKSIAVLPFVNMSPDKDQDYFCDGISEEIINALVHVESFKVIARTSAFSFKGQQVDIREIGRILDVETVLEGSIRKDGNRLRITAQLIKIADGSHIWSERYDCHMKDVFSIQDEISLAILNNLKVKLLGETKAMITKRHSENLEAYNLYLKGTYCWQMMTIEGYKKASEYFEQALRKDPDYALAYVGFATVKIASTAYGDVPPNEAFPKAIEYVNKALKIDNTLDGAYSALGVINTFYYWNWKEAERNFKHALQINPNSSLIHIYYSFLLTCTRLHKEAISEAKRAQELDPLSYFINTFTGVAYAFAGQFDRAIKEYQMTLTINPNYFFAHNQLGIAYFGKSMLKEGVAELEKAVDLSDGNPLATTILVLGYYLIRKKDQADKLFESLKKRSETEYIPATSIYLIHRIRGEKEMALEWLKRACIEHDTSLLWYRARQIRKDSQYMAVLKEMGLMPADKK
jgi:TolB-like protein/Tfp pilus assembly protein PilF